MDTVNGITSLPPDWISSTTLFHIYDNPTLYLRDTQTKNASSLETAFSNKDGDIENTVSGDHALLSNSALEGIETVVNGLILPVLVLFGVTGNVINMAVFSRQGLRDRVNVCLFFLALSDTGFLVSHLLSRIYILFYLFDAHLGDFWKSHWFYFIGVYHAFLNTSNSLTLVLSLERCICVAFPLRAKTILSARSMLGIVAVLFTLSVAGNWMACTKYRMEDTFNPATNSSQLILYTTEFYENNRGWFHAVHEVAFNVIIPTASLVVVMAATVVICLRMRSALLWRESTAQFGGTLQATSSSSTSQREAAVTRMLLVVCVVYTVCITPTVAQALLRTFFAEFVGGGRYNNVFFASLSFTHLLESVNSSINFIIYYMMSTRFKQTLRCCAGKGKKTSAKSELEGSSAVSTVSSCPTRQTGR